MVLLLSSFSYAVIYMYSMIMDTSYITPGLSDSITFSIAHLAKLEEIVCFRRPPRSFNHPMFLYQISDVFS